MYFLRVLEARSQNQCVSRSYSLQRRRGNSILASSSFWGLQRSLASGCISPISACLHVTIPFLHACLLYVCPVACAIGFSKQKEVYALKPLGKVILASSSACLWCSALALSSYPGWDNTPHPRAPYSGMPSNCSSPSPCVLPSDQSLLI